MQFEIRRRFSAPPEQVYQAWLDGEKHEAMTGGSATIDPREGGAFTAWDEYISGTTLELIENRKIVQSWRTVEFEDKDEDSRLELIFKPDGDGTMVTLRHTDIPEGQPDYEQGWIDNYFIPMREYFED